MKFQGFLRAWMWRDVLYWPMIEHVAQSRPTQPWKGDWQGLSYKKCSNRAKIILLFSWQCCTKAAWLRHQRYTESQSWKAAEWCSYHLVLKLQPVQCPCQEAGQPSKEAHYLFVCIAPLVQGQPRLLVLPPLWVEASLPVAASHWPWFYFLDWIEQYVVCL